LINNEDYARSNVWRRCHTVALLQHDAISIHIGARCAVAKRNGDNADQGRTSYLDRDQSSVIRLAEMGICARKFFRGVRTSDTIANDSTQLVKELVFTLLAINIPAFIYSYMTEPAVDVVDDEVGIVVKETTLKEVDPTAEVNGEKNALDGAPVVEELDIQESVLVELKPLRPAATLLWGIPNPRSLLLTASTLLINMACVVMIVDRLYSEHRYTAEDLSFARVGYVSDTEAKILIREPNQDVFPITVDVRLRDPVPPFEDDEWYRVGGVRYTSYDTDYTAVVPVPLKASAQKVFEWRTSNNHSGLLTSAPKAGHTQNLYSGKFTFLTTSCLISRLPYSPFDHPLAIPGLRHLARLLPSLEASFMLFLGDFIYVDVPKRFGSKIPDYRQKYRQVYASPDWPAVGQNLSWIHVLDDHEIANDWDANTTGLYQAAADPWQHYHVAANPPAARRAHAALARPGATYFSFTQGPASFFMLDTRKYRDSNKVLATEETKSLLGEGQLEDLLDFLARPEPKGVKWKIIASSVPFTKNWKVNTQDTWGGYLVERRKVLEAMWDAGTKGYGVIVLSGDRHEFAATKLPPPADSAWPETAAVYEFSVSPLSQFASPLPSYFQSDSEDVKIKYIHKGMSKFGAITIEMLGDGTKSSLKYRLFVDGVETWDTVILTPDPVPVSKVGGGFWERFRKSNK
jgi:alkaline phosphatase D